MHSWFNSIEKKFSQYIIGHEHFLQVILTTLLSNGHVLLEGLPGIGKTFSVKVLSRLLGINSERIQFTPDMLPSDILGHLFYKKESETFSFRKGPIFSNLILADEINRTPPKTQSALLEAMEEAQVTIERKNHPLPKPYLVLATQNPIEIAGTYPLPEAQLDRFMVMLRIGFPNKEEEKKILHNAIQGKDSKHLNFEEIKSVTNAQEIERLSKETLKVSVSDSLIDYILRLIRNTRKHKSIVHGVSPRAATHLLQLARSWAFKEERDFLIPDDIQQLFKYVVYHRIILSTEAQMESIDKDKVLDEIINSQDAPR